jgi:hypothetical protein
MSKSLCKSKKSKKNNQDTAALADCDGEFMCRKCDRVASKKKKLCKPVKAVRGVE